MSDADMKEEGQSPVQPQQATTSPGAQLAGRRESLGWTIEQVANQLNLAPRQVQAIEDDNYAALPGIVIARGFVRAYAKLVKLEPAPLLALIVEKDAPSPESLELRRTLSATFTESSLPVAKRSGGGRKWLVLVLLLAVAGAAGWGAWRGGWLDGLQLPGGITAGSMTAGETTPSNKTQPEALGAADANNGVPMGQAEVGAQPAPAETASPVPAQSGSQEQAAPPAAAPESVTPPTAAQGAPAAGAASQQLPAPAATAAVASGPSRPGSQAAAGAADKLVLKMREASWIELKRDDGSAVTSRLLPAGATESFDVGPGARLVVGNASGVDATYRGQALDLKTDAKNNVARLKLK